MKLTREEAIYECRKMWNWIADKTEERKRIVEKWEYFIENGIEEFPDCKCYLCEYDDTFGGGCKHCLLKFTLDDNSFCYFGDSPFYKWNKIQIYCGGYKLAAKYAREIANLPEK